MNQVPRRVVTWPSAARRRCSSTCCIRVSRYPLPRFSPCSGMRGRDFEADTSTAGRSGSRRRRHRRKPSPKRPRGRDRRGDGRRGPARDRWPVAGRSDGPPGRRTRPPRSCGRLFAAPKPTPAICPSTSSTTRHWEQGQRRSGRSDHFGSHDPVPRTLGSGHRVGGQVEVARSPPAGPLSAAARGMRSGFRAGPLGRHCGTGGAGRLV